MSCEPVPDSQALKAAFDHNIYSSSGNPLKFGSLFYDCDVYPAEKRILVIFIRHFFCGNCQEYVRRLSSTDSPFHPSLKPTSTTWTTNFSKPANRILPTVVIIGPGQPSLIANYKSLTQCPFEIYADPSTQLYNIMGMHRTLSMGKRAPGYIEHSLLSGAVKSAWQIVRRVGSGDAMAGGNWDVNGGEYLFTRPAVRPRAGSRSPSSSRSRSRSASSRASSSLDWEATWCHRMVNSRDHTELTDLAYNTCFSVQSSPTSSTSGTNSPAPPLKPILLNATKTHDKTIPHSYSSERLGSCPAPDILKSRVEVLANPHHTHTLARSQSKSKSPRRQRSRSTSVGSRTTAKQNHDRVWANISSADASRSESSESTTVPRDNVAVSPISEAEEEEVKPRRSFSASLADALGVRKTLLSRSRSVSAPSETADETAPALPRPTTPLSEARSSSRSSSRDRRAKPSSRTITKSIALLRSRSKSKQQRVESLPPQNSYSTRRSRSRTSSTSKSSSSSKHRPSLSLTRKTSGSVETGENGVMYVDGVEFVNVISVKARVDSEEEKRRKTLRERADSGLGMGVDEEPRGRKETLPPVPVPVPAMVSGQGQGYEQKKYSALPALPEVAGVH